MVKIHDGAIPSAWFKMLPVLTTYDTLPMMHAYGPACIRAWDRPGPALGSGAPSHGTILHGEIGHCSTSDRLSFLRRHHPRATSTFDHTNTIASAHESCIQRVVPTPSLALVRDTSTCMACEHVLQDKYRGIASW